MGVTLTLEWPVSVRELVVSMEISPDIKYAHAIEQEASEVQGIDALQREVRVGSAAP